MTLYSYNTISTWVSAAEGGGGGDVLPPWIFIHGTDVEERGLIVLLFNLFLLPPTPGRGLIVLFFGIFSFFFSFPSPFWKILCRHSCISTMVLRVAAWIRRPKGLFTVPLPFLIVKLLRKLTVNTECSMVFNGINKLD